MRSHRCLTYQFRAQGPGILCSIPKQWQDGVCNERVAELKRGPWLSLPPCHVAQRERKCCLHSCIFITLILTSNKKEMCLNQCPGNWAITLFIFSSRDWSREKLKRLKRDRRRQDETASPAIIRTFLNTLRCISKPQQYKLIREKGAKCIKSEIW